MNPIEKRKKKLSYSSIIAILVIILIGLILISFTLGRYPIPITELLGIVGSRLWNGFVDFGTWLLNFTPGWVKDLLGLGNIQIESVTPFWTTTQSTILFNVRLPRLFLSCLVGCCLATAGASYQGVFQNPMAAPDILGASSGACLGAALAILLHWNSRMVTVTAFVFSIATITLVMFVGERARGNKLMGLILAGIMISSLCSSGTSFIKLVADPNNDLPEITYWLMGSLAKTSTSDLLFALIPMVIGLVPLFLIRWRINLLTISDDEASTMGVNVKAIRILVIVCATLVTAASVSVSGMIGWVGLVIPHLSRRLIGNNYRHLMPATMLSGAIFLLLVDNVSRNLLQTEIPIGILTSVVGAPFFIWLITRKGELT